MARMPFTTVVSVIAGDTGGLTFYLTEEDKRTVRSLTGHGAWVSFWHPGSAPHVERQARVDAANGAILYERQGDEFDAAGTVIAQASVATPDGVTGVGRGFIVSAFPPVTFDVKARST